MRSATATYFLYFFAEGETLADVESKPFSVSKEPVNIPGKYFFIAVVLVLYGLCDNYKNL